MPPYLRAFLFDSSQPSSNLVENVFSSWDSGIGVAVISSNQPKMLVDKSIVRCDPNEVNDLSSEITTTRKLAIVETPDLGAVVLTSGTTADPKPVELSFRSMRNAVTGTYEATELDKSASWLCCLPPYYIAGLAVFARCWVNESRLIFHEKFDVRRIADAIKSNDITAISLVSSQLQKLIDAHVDLSGFRTVLVGGSSISPALLSKCKEKKIALTRTYGLTETWGGICHDGTLFANTKARVNPNGVVEISSSALMSGYRHDYPGTIERISPDGWFITNDRGEIRDGLLTIFGRDDDVINSGGIKVDPEVVESLLRAAFPRKQMWICPTPHDSYGQCVTVCIKESEEEFPALAEIRNALRKDLPSTHLPLRVASIDSIPTTENGKIKRKKLSEKCIIVDEHTRESL